jgi:hypothetical protein
MRKINSIVSIICLIAISINIYLHLDTRTYQDSTPIHDAQGAIGPAIILILSWTITSILAGILFLIRIVMGIMFKELFRASTILVIGLIILTFLTPVTLFYLI